MFLISFLAVVLIIGLNTVFSGVNITYFFDGVSMLILLLVVVPVLIQTGLLKDFNNSFRLTMRKNNVTSFKEIKRAVEALKVVRKTSSYTAIFTFCVSIIAILCNVDSLESLGPNLVVAILILVYAALLNIIFFPMEKQLEVRLIEFDGEFEKFNEEKQLEKTEIPKRLEMEESLELKLEQEEEQQKIKQV